MPIDEVLARAPPGRRAAFVEGSAQPARRTPLAVRVSRDLLERIEGGELRPGEQVPTEHALMQRYGVSRTVVREAISSLRAAGRVATRQGRGAFVLAPPAPAPLPGVAEIGRLRDVVKLVEIRLALEAEAAALAAQRRATGQMAELDAISAAFAASADTPERSTAHDQDFHLCVARMSGNEYFADLLAGLSPNLLPRARVDLFGGDRQAHSDYLRRLETEHAQIRDAIGRADAEGARAAMRLHLTNSRERLLAALRAAAASAGETVAPESACGGCGPLV